MTGAANQGQNRPGEKQSLRDTSKLLKIMELRNPKFGTGCSLMSCEVGINLRYKVSKYELPKVICRKASIGTPIAQELITKGILQIMTSVLTWLNQCA